MRAPLDPELEEVRGDATPFGVRSDALVNESLHALDEFGGGEAGLRVGLATELAVNDRTHAFQHAPHQTLHKRLVPLLLFLFTHNQRAADEAESAGPSRRQSLSAGEGES